MSVTGIPFSMQRRTISSPGSLIPGIPASVTSAQDSPLDRRATISSPRAFLLCSKYEIIGFEIPKHDSSFRLLRVSSAATKSTSDSVLSARSDISERFPIGVATRYSVPALIAFFSVMMSFINFLDYQ